MMQADFVEGKAKDEWFQLKNGDLPRGEIRVKITLAHIAMECYNLKKKKPYVGTLHINNFCFES